MMEGTNEKEDTLNQTLQFLAISFVLCVDFLLYVHIFNVNAQVK